MLIYVSINPFNPYMCWGSSVDLIFRKMRIGIAASGVYQPLRSTIFGFFFPYFQTNVMILYGLILLIFDCNICRPMYKIKLFLN